MAMIFLRSSNMEFCIACHISMLSLCQDWFLTQIRVPRALMRCLAQADPYPTVPKHVHINITYLFSRPVIDQIDYRSAYRAILYCIARQVRIALSGRSFPGGWHDKVHAISRYLAMTYIRYDERTSICTESIRPRRHVF